ncbi:MAG: GerAB/ArcD/ProY family transporter [bacterium]
MSLAHMVRIAFFENLQAIIMSIWVGGVSIKIGVFMWCAVLSLSQTINLKEYRPLVPPPGILLVVFALVSVENHIELRETLHHITPLYAFVFEFLVPLLLLVAVNVRAWLDPTFPRKP